MTHTRRPLLPLILAAIALLLPVGASGARGAAPFGGFGGASRASEPVRVTLEAQPAEAAPGGSATLRVVLEHADGWHTYPPGNVGPEDIVSMLIPVSVEARTPNRLTAGAARFPDPEMVPVPEALRTGDAGATYGVLPKRTVIEVPLTIGRNAQPGEVSFPVAVQYQACDDRTCLPPRTVELTATVRIAEGERALAAIPPGIIPGVGAEAGEADSGRPRRGGFAAGSSGPDAEAPAPAAAPTPPPASGTFFGIRLSGGGVLGLLVLGVAAAAGGLVLNLTPCVLPVIPIKVLTLSQHAGSRGRTFYLGVWMAAGVVAFWAALGVPAALVSAFADPSRIFGIWWVSVGLGVAMILLAMGLMGMFALNLPQSVYMVNPKTDNEAGSFLFGVMTGVLGLPCFGFVAGGLIPMATTLGAPVVMLIFTSIGVGMALPYLVLAAFPRLIDRLPRTGPASELVKQFLGLLMVAAGLFFLGAGLISLAATYPFLARQLHLFAVAIVVVLAGGWLAWRTVAITRRPVNRAAFVAVGALFALAGLWLGIGAAVGAREEHVVRSESLARVEEAERARVERLEAALAQAIAQLEAGASGDGAEAAIAALRAAQEDSGARFITSTWIDYDPQRLEAAVDAGYAVFLDFTAEWCINCKVFEKTVLDAEPVRSVLRGDRVVMMKVDLTGSNPAGEAALSAIGRTGIPAWAVYGPALPEGEPIVIDTYTPGQVLSALDRALGEPASGASVAAR